MAFKDIEAKRAWDRADYHRHPERLITRNLRRPSQRKTNLASRYGLSINEYEQMVKDQAGVCGCCGKTPTTKRLSVDHNHTNGQVRALVCTRCNNAIAFLEHPDMSKWQKYLEDHSKSITSEYATADEIAEYLGTRNWVVTRRTAKTIARYGADVVCLSAQKYRKMTAAILLSRRSLD